MCLPGAKDTYFPQQAWAAEGSSASSSSSSSSRGERERERAKVIANVAETLSLQPHRFHNQKQHQEQRQSPQQQHSHHHFLLTSRAQATAKFRMNCLTLYILWLTVLDEALFGGDKNWAGKSTTSHREQCCWDSLCVWLWGGGGGARAWKHELPPICNMRSKVTGLTHVLATTSSNREQHATMTLRKDRNPRFTPGQMATLTCFVEQGRWTCDGSSKCYKPSLPIARYSHSNEMFRKNGQAQ